jgi:catechol 2,3-dioxygenase-like lactoylglutathione lyase family enzyme
LNVQNLGAGPGPSKETIVDWKLELVVVPVSDVDRAKAFYSEQAGFDVNVDTSPSEHFRVVQLNPPGSACSIAIGTGIGDMTPGSLKGLHLVVSDIEAACAELSERGVKLGEMHHFVDGVQTPGPHPERADYGTFSSFDDPDGNTWVIQEVGRANA